MLRSRRFRLDKRVRLLCPQRHFIAMLRVYDIGDGLRITPVYPPGRGKFFDIHQEDPETGETVHMVEMECGNRSHGYHPRGRYAKLVAEVATTVAAGGVEHRLTW